MLNLDFFEPNLLLKVELHIHLDTSLSYFYIKKRWPNITLADFNRLFVAQEPCVDLGDFLSKITAQIGILQTKKAIALAVDDLFHQLKQDNVIYAEIRFAPLLHTQQGLTANEVVECVLSAMKESSSHYKIEAGLILCTLRHFTEQQSIQTANLVMEYLNKGVVALDLAADEARYDLAQHINAFYSVKNAGGNVIAHAGEAKGAHSVIETIDKLSVSRIGHGVRSIEDIAAIEKIKQHNILLEVCPSCNIICNVYPSITEHPVNQLKQLGVKLSINTDARTVANTTLNKEYQLLHNVFNWHKNDFNQCNIDALKASFISDTSIKRRLIDQISYV